MQCSGDKWTQLFSFSAGCHGSNYFASLCLFLRCQVGLILPLNFYECAVTENTRCARSWCVALVTRSSSRPAYASLELVTGQCPACGVYKSTRGGQCRLLPETGALENPHCKHWIVLYHFSVSTVPGTNMQFEPQEEN